jgi:hypothetical protein
MLKLSKLSETKLIYIEVLYLIFRQFYQVTKKLLSLRLLGILSKLRWPAHPCGRHARELRYRSFARCGVVAL